MTEAHGNRLAHGLCDELSSLLEAELAAGNSVRDIGPAPGSNGTLVLLSRSFRAEPGSAPSQVYLVPVNDPHWWKEEYRCRLHPHVLACPFD
jgi:hypothetical protein